MREIPGDPPPGDLLELPVIDAAVPELRLVLVIERIVRVALVPMQSHVMVGPDDVELHAVVQVTVIQTSLKKRHTVIPAPVVDECAHAVVGCRGDLHFHDVAVRFVDIAPDRKARLLMAFEFWRVLHEGFPLPDAHRPQDSCPVVGVIRRPYESGDIVALGAWAGRLNRWRLCLNQVRCGQKSQCDCRQDVCGRSGSHSDSLPAVFGRS
jgi:hypothetical protein